MECVELNVTQVTLFLFEQILKRQFVRLLNKNID